MDNNGMNKFKRLGNVVRVEHEGRVYRVFLDRLAPCVVKQQIFSRGYSHYRDVRSLKAREISKLVDQAGFKYEEQQS